MNVKICGICTLDDALYAIDAGADMLGYNFYPPSKRYLTPQGCERIQAGLMNRGLSITTVGVFVNAFPRAVETTLDVCGLRLAQLHGDEPPEMLEELGERAFKAIRPRTFKESRTLAARYPARLAPPDFLIDAYHLDHYGGMGQTGDWEVAQALTDDHNFLLAGGLHPGNVGAAVRQIRPWGVDVASGVEDKPGKKDFTKMQQFVNRARAAAGQVEEEDKEGTIKD